MARIRTVTERFVGLAGGDDPGRDVVVSGVGLHAGLLVLAAGAGPGFEAAARTATGAAGDEAAAALADLDHALADLAGVEHAVAVWSRATLLDRFPRALTTADFFDDLDQATLDQWTRDHTAGLIERFPCEIRPSTRLAIADAVALVGRWVQPFPQERTRTDTFVRADGHGIDVPFMAATGTSSGWQAGATTVVELVCADEDGRRGARLRLGLGTPDAVPSAVLAEVLGPVGPPLEGTIDLLLPRVSLRQHHDLTAILTDLGLGGCFTDDRFLAGATDEPLVVEQAAQEALVQFDEQGVKAAAVTAFPAQRGGPPPRLVPVRFDRPFAFALVDPESGLAVFAGWVADPGTGAGPVA